MSVEVRGATETITTLKSIENLLKSTKPMEGIVEDIKETIEKRTSSGKD